MPNPACLQRALEYHPKCPSLRLGSRVGTRKPEQGCRGENRGAALFDGQKAHPEPTWIQRRERSSAVLVDERWATGRRLFAGVSRLWYFAEWLKVAR
ncbi:hypothetical protein [Thiorhodococcus fuscus]|uniref:Uncharacterized protein n=1 Tax=Thiorhodococcus fuscus TaxID=527200 RepID=A0ABW4Y9N1_9GAMM